MCAKFRARHCTLNNYSVSNRRNFPDVIFRFLTAAEPIKDVSFYRRNVLNHRISAFVLLLMSTLEIVPFEERFVSCLSRARPELFVRCERKTSEASSSVTSRIIKINNRDQFARRRSSHRAGRANRPNQMKTKQEGSAKPSTTGVSATLRAPNEMRLPGNRPANGRASDNQSWTSFLAWPPPPNRNYSLLGVN
jgi:hypothetical protein